MIAACRGLATDEFHIDLDSTTLLVDHGCRGRLRIPPDPLRLQALTQKRSGMNLVRKSSTLFFQSTRAHGRILYPLRRRPRVEFVPPGDRRVVDDQIYPLDSLREPVRLAAGLTPDKRLTEEAQQRALKALACFGERLRGLPRGGTRRRHQHPAGGQECQGLPHPRRGGARLPHRGRRRARGGPPHLPGRGAQPAGHARQAAGGRHRRRLDRIHHRQRVQAAPVGKPVHG